MNGKTTHHIGGPRHAEVTADEMADQIASLKERMAAVQEKMCLLLDETAALGLKWNFNVSQENGRHKCVQTLIREY